MLRTELDASKDLVTAARLTFRALEGSASVAMLFDHLDTMLLATNTGSLFQVTAGSTMMFASERFILQRVIDQAAVSSRIGAVSQGLPSTFQKILMTVLF